MSKYIDNTPKKENNTESKKTNLGENEVKINVVKPADNNHIFQPINFVEPGLPTSITTNIDTNTYDVWADKTNNDDKQVDKESENSDEESIDIDEVFKDHINIAFVSALSIVGLFIFFRMFQKSR